MDWSTACPDWRDRIIAGQSLIPMPPLFPDEAEAALDVYRALKIVDAPGSPTIGEACKPWITDFAAAVFGSYDAETGRRLIREYLLLVSKKNWKSGLAASIMMTALIRNWRQENEFLILAPTIEVANNSFGPASAMVRADDELKDLFHIQEHYRKITHRQTGASLKVVAADNEAVSGKKAAGVLVDELWLFGKRQNAENMLREACGGLVSRPEGFVIYLSTMSDEPPSGVFKQRLSYFRDVRDGKIDDKKSLGVLYEFPESLLDPTKKEFLKPENFYVTNPNLGVSVDAEWLEDELRKAQEGGQDSVTSFAAKHLNVEIGLALRNDRWGGADHWLAAASSGLTLNDILSRCDVVTVGIDGGGADDLLGLTAIGREKITRRWMAWSHAWAHPIALERRKHNITEYKKFEAAGEMTIIAQYPDDLDGVVEIVRTIKDSGLLGGVGVDTIGLAGVVEALAEIGVSEDAELLFGIGQGYVLTGAIKGVERKLIDGSFIHAGQLLMAWAVGNAKVEPTKNAFLITKQASGLGKIDPLMALFDAAKLMERNPTAKGGNSVYNQIAADQAEQAAAEEKAKGETIGRSVYEAMPMPREIAAQRPWDNPEI